MASEVVDHRSSRAFAYLEVVGSCLATAVANQSHTFEAAEMVGPFLRCTSTADLRAVEGIDLEHPKAYHTYLVASSQSPNSTCYEAACPEVDRSCQSHPSYAIRNSPSVVEACLAQVPRTYLQSSLPIGRVQANVVPVAPSNSFRSVGRP